MTQLELSKQTPDCIGAKLLITSIALRAYRNRQLGTIISMKLGNPLKTAVRHFLLSVLTSSD